MKLYKIKFKIYTLKIYKFIHIYMCTNFCKNPDLNNFNIYYFKFNFLILNSYLMILKTFK